MPETLSGKWARTNQELGLLDASCAGAIVTCNDLRLLSSGPEPVWAKSTCPRCNLVPRSCPGKSIPSSPKFVSQVAYKVIGSDVTITMAAAAGRLQLNAFEPLIVHSLDKSISHLCSAVRTLTERCVRGITVPSHLS
jgi:aspartate ammonia-lyase